MMRCLLFVLIIVVCEIKSMDKPLSVLPNQEQLMKYYKEKNNKLRSSQEKGVNSSPKSSPEGQARKPNDSRLPTQINCGKK